MFGRMLGISPQDRQHVSPPFEMDNRGKRSVVLDRTTADGQARVRELLSDADVFLTNMLHPDSFTNYRPSVTLNLCSTIVGRAWAQWIGGGMKVEVDRAKCTGHGICESIAEEVFDCLLYTSPSPRDS